MNQPLVSVIVPTRNSGDSLKSCLSSIKKQTYPAVELIVVDNNSIDKTKVIARRYTNKVYNCGPERSSQRNFGAAKAKGKFLLFVDSDMKLAPQVASQCVNATEGRNVVGVIVPEESFGRGFWAQCKKLERSFYLGVDWIEAGRFFQRKVFFLVGGYDPRIISGEDWDLSQRACKYGKLKRISAFIYHNEGKPTLLQLISKKFYYAQKFDEYTRKKANQKFFRLQISVFGRYKLFFKKPNQLFADPLLGVGMLLMKGLEFSWGAFGYFFYRNRKSADVFTMAVSGKGRFPKVSIIIPTLNAQKYLRICLESIKKQDYPVNKIETIIVDGGSTDDTVDIARKYRTTILSNPKRIAEYGKAIGIKASTGKYFVLLDSDNEIVEENWLKLMTKPLLTEKRIFGVESPLAHDSHLSGLNRYFARMRIADPLAKYLASKPKVIEKKESFDILKFARRAVLVTGANGFLWNKDLVMKYPIWLEKFEEANYSSYIHLKTNANYAIPRNASIRHYYCEGVISYVKKRTKIAEKVNERLRNKEYTWIMQTNKLRFFGVGLYLLTVVGPTLEACYHCINEKTLDWLWHPLISLLTVVIYFLYTVKSAARSLIS